MGVSYPIVCVCGPTAVGKSSLGIELAKKLSAEVINADSVQVYPGFDIGSGKVTKEEMGEVTHHLLSHLNLDEVYSAGRFRKEAFRVIRDVSSRGKFPMVVGGTGLYIRALLSEFLGNLENVYGESLDYSRTLIDFFKSSNSEAEFLKKISDFIRLLDFDVYKKNGQADLFRNERALIHSLAFGVPSSLYRKVFNEEKYNLSALVIILEEEREVLYRKIDHRVQMMFDQGWIEEVKQILSQNRNCFALRAIGYRHISSEIDTNHLESLSKLSLINNIQRDTRRFAKRQITWWRNQPAALGWRALVESDFNSVLNDESSLLARLTGEAISLDASPNNFSVIEGTKKTLIASLVKFINIFKTEFSCASQKGKVRELDFDNSVFYIRVKITGDD